MKSDSRGEKKDNKIFDFMNFGFMDNKKSEVIMYYPALILNPVSDSQPRKYAGIFSNWN